MFFFPCIFITTFISVYHTFLTEFLFNKENEGEGTKLNCMTTIMNTRQ